MPMTNVEVHEAEQRMEELIDTVLHGQEVVITHFGEPVAVLGVHRLVQEDPPAWVRAAMAKVIDEALEHLRGQLVPPSWRLN
jgi:antitoxin (DNA-binding transcriptional repressor) of toxin-antitoxin stability system